MFPQRRLVTCMTPCIAGAFASPYKVQRHLRPSQLLEGEEHRSLV